MNREELEDGKKVAAQFDGEVYFAVWTGQYSDSWVAAVFPTETEALTWMRAYERALESPYVDTVTFRPKLAPQRKNMAGWLCTYEKDAWDIEEYRLYGRYRLEEDNPGWQYYVFARTEQAALKIAADRLRQDKAEGRC